MRSRYETDTELSGFEWIDCNDADTSVLSMLRKDSSCGEAIAVVFNFTRVPRQNALAGVPHCGPQPHPARFVRCVPQRLMRAPTTVGPWVGGGTSE